MDPHKWLFAPFDCAALIYQDPHLAKAVHTQDASYLDVIHTDAPDEWNPTDYAYHLTRRARGLPLWFSLAVHGTDAYADAIESVAGAGPRGRRADRRGPEPRADPRARSSSVVLFRRRGWTAAGLRHAGPSACWPARSRSSPRPAGKARPWPASPSCIPGTTAGIVREILATMA